jgi:hypothetical protein
MKLLLLNEHGLFDCMKEMMMGLRATPSFITFKKKCQFIQLCVGATSIAEGNYQRNQGIEFASDACGQSVAPKVAARPSFG